MSYTFFDITKQQESSLELKNCTIKGNNSAYVTKDGVITKYKIVNGEIDKTSGEVVSRIELTSYQMSFIDLIKEKDGNDARLDEKDLKDMTPESLQEEINALYKEKGVYEAVSSDIGKYNAEIGIKDNTDAEKRIGIEFEKDKISVSKGVLCGVAAGILGGIAVGFKHGIKRGLLFGILGGIAGGIAGGIIGGILNRKEEKIEEQEPPKQTQKPIKTGPKILKTYTVKEGDNLEKIAHAHGLYRWELINANDSVDDNTVLQIGQELKIPEPTPIKTYADINAPTKKFLEALAERESTNNPKAKNNVGYLGLYQMGEPALISIGVYKQDRTEKNDWIGSWNKDNKLGITGEKDFLNNTEKQHNAVIRYAQLNWIDIKRHGLHKYVGKTIAGVQITESGLIAGAHLVGVGGLKKFLKSNGRNDVKDGNGTPVSSYVRQFANYDISDFKSL